jgi:hypothetical protein
VADAAAEAREWIALGTVGSFSFDMCCAWLNLDAPSVRRAILDGAPRRRADDEIDHALAAIARELDVLSRIAGRRRRPDDPRLVAAAVLLCLRDSLEPGLARREIAERRNSAEETPVFKRGAASCSIRWPTPAVLP